MGANETDEVLDIDIDKLLPLPIEEIEWPEAVTYVEEDNRFKGNDKFREINECAEILRKEEKQKKKNEAVITCLKNELTLKCMGLIEKGLLLGIDETENRSNRYERAFEAMTQALLWAIKVYCNRDGRSDKTTFAALFFGAYKRIKRLTPFAPSEKDPSYEKWQSETAKDIIITLMNQYGLNEFCLNGKKIKLNSEKFKKILFYSTTFCKALDSLYDELEARNKIQLREEEITKRIVYFVELAFGRQLSIDDLGTREPQTPTPSYIIDDLAMIMLKAYSYIKGNKQDQSEPYQRYYALFYMFMYDLFRPEVYHSQFGYKNLWNQIEADDQIFVKGLQENVQMQLMDGSVEQRLLHGKQELSRIISELTLQKPGTTIKKINKAEGQFKDIFKKAAADLGFRFD